MKYLCVIFFNILMSFVLIAQNFTNQKPKSLEKNFRYEKSISVGKNKILLLPVDEKDITKIEHEDSLLMPDAHPFRYGYPLDVSLNLNNSGEWLILSNGDRIWRLVINSKNAKSIGLIYDKFWLPENGTLHIYNSNMKQIIGAFTSKNNKGTKNEIKGFATSNVKGEEIVLEYYEPKEYLGQGIISISKVIHAYIDVLGSYGISCSNNVNINCSPEGDDWQKEKTGVAMIDLGGTLCSGSLIRNASKDGTLYFLTANHCIYPKHDAIDNPNAPEYIFYWIWESADCSNGSNFTPLSTTGAEIISNSWVVDCDFALLKLNESPYNLNIPVKAFFNGWDRRQPGLDGACIHHPRGDIKKIATFDSIYTKHSGLWVIELVETLNGYCQIQPGSSGSPLLNNNHLIIGQASNVQIANDCDHPELNVPAFGKFSSSWLSTNNTSNPKRRLKDWLDPNNTNIQYLEGGFCDPAIAISDVDYSLNSFITGGIISINNVTIQNNANVTFDSSCEISINSTFEVKLGSQLELK